MNAKSYLQQLQRLDVVINQKMEELCSLKSRVISTTVNVGDEKVQTSGAGDKVGRAVPAIIDLENEIDTEISRFNGIKHDIINKIQNMEKVIHITILYKRYVQYEKFEKIALEMNYSYQSILNMHGSALENFKRKYKM